MNKQWKRLILAYLLSFSILGQTQAELKPLLLLPYEDYYIRGSYRFQWKKEGLETGSFEILHKGGRNVYCKVLSNGDAVTVPSKTLGSDIQWPAKLCREKLRMHDRDIFLSSESGGIGVISIPEDPNSEVAFCEPYVSFLNSVKVLTDFPNPTTIQEESGNRYVLSQIIFGRERKINLTVGTNGLISHADVDYNGKRVSTNDIEYRADCDFPKRFSKIMPDKTEVFQFDEVLTGTVASERPTTLTLLQNGLHISDNRFQYVVYDVTNGAFMSDEEAFAIESKTQQEVKARNAAREVELKKSMVNAAATSAASNDPHNMKNVPVTGESWGKQLRRIPNWAYGGAVVLFLGGWIVAASRRRRK